MGVQERAMDGYWDLGAGNEKGNHLKWVSVRPFVRPSVRPELPTWANIWFLPGFVKFQHPA